jgi:phosphatidylinositol alpha-1,6-mannosyltransferase
VGDRERKRGGIMSGKKRISTEPQICKRWNWYMQDKLKIGSFSIGYPDTKYRVKFIFTHEQALALQNSASDVEIFDLHADTNLFSDFTIDNFEGIVVYRIPNISVFLHPIKKIQYYLRIRKICNDKKFNFLLFSFLSVHYFPLLFFLPTSILRGITVHGVDAMGIWERWDVKTIKRHLLSKMDFIFPVSDHTKLLIQTMMNPKDYKKIILNYNGIRKEKFKNIGNFDKIAIRELLKIRSKYVLLTICDLVPRKGVDISLKADLILMKDGLDFTHIIIGNGPEKGRLQELTKELGLTDRILWIDYISDDEELIKYYAISDVYTMISKTTYKPLGLEGFGISYIEAQYTGLPVVGGNSGGVSTSVKDGITGFLVDPDSVCPEKSIAYYLKKILLDEKLYHEMSQNGRLFVLNNFDWQKNAKNIERLLKNS